jgi:hypothetical protein
LRPGEIVEPIGRRLSLSGRSSLLGSAGKEAIVAPGGVVANAAKITLARAGDPGRERTAPLPSRSRRRCYDETDRVGFA